MRLSSLPECLAVLTGVLVLMCGALSQPCVILDTSHDILKRSGFCSALKPSLWHAFPAGGNAILFLIFLAWINFIWDLASRLFCGLCESYFSQLKERYGLAFITGRTFPYGFNVAYREIATFCRGNFWRLGFWPPLIVGLPPPLNRVDPIFMWAAQD